MGQALFCQMKSRLSTTTCNISSLQSRFLSQGNCITISLETHFKIPSQFLFLAFFVQHINRVDIELFLDIMPLILFGFLSQAVPSIQTIKKTKRVYRTRISEKPNVSINLWSIMKNCIGKELTKIPMPVCMLLIFLNHFLYIFQVIVE